MSRATSSTATATPQPKQTTTMHIPQEKIAMRAYEKWCKRGCPQGGTDRQDWFEAEIELRQELGRGQGQTSQARR